MSLRRRGPIVYGYAPPLVVGAMETRTTLRPGQKGTRKLLERFGERLVCVRYLYDAEACRRYTTVELIVASDSWHPRRRRPRRRDDEIVAVRIAYPETDSRERAKRLGAVWRPAQKLWKLSWLDAKRLGIADRVVTTPPHSEASKSRHLPA